MRCVVRARRKETTAWSSHRFTRVLLHIVEQVGIELPAADAPGHVLGVDAQAVGELQTVLLVVQPDEDADDAGWRAHVDAEQLAGVEVGHAAEDRAARRAVDAVGHVQEELVAARLGGKQAAQRSPHIDVGIECAAAALALLVVAEAEAAMRGEARACRHGIGAVEAEPAVFLAGRRLAGTRRDLAESDIEVRLLRLGLALVAVIGADVADLETLAVAGLELETAGLALAAAPCRHQGAVVDQESRADGAAAAVAVGPLADGRVRIGRGDFDAPRAAELLGAGRGGQRREKEHGETEDVAKHEQTLVQTARRLPLG